MIDKYLKDKYSEDVNKIKETFDVENDFFQKERKKRAVIISGVSGAGKTTLIRKLLEDDNYELVKSVTTRKSRGADDYYYHVNKENFYSFPGGFLETNEYNNHFYGTPLIDIERIINKGKIPVLDIDINGFQQVIMSRKLELNITSIFILADPKQIYDRLRNRKTDSNEDILKRMKISLNEVKAAVSYDYVLRNDNLELAKEQLIRMINNIEKTKSKMEDIQSFIDNMKRIIQEKE